MTVPYYFDTTRYLSESQCRDLIPISPPRWSDWKRRGWAPPLTYLLGKKRPVIAKADMREWLALRAKHRTLCGKPYLLRPLTDAELRHELERLGDLAMEGAA